MFRLSPNDPFPKWEEEEDVVLLYGKLAGELCQGQLQGLQNAVCEKAAK